MSGRRRRRCVDCGAGPEDAAFPGSRKPNGRLDRCRDCLADPGGVGLAARCVARRAAIHLQRVTGTFVRTRPVHTTPLFASLRPTAPRARARRHGAAPS